MAKKKIDINEIKEATKPIMKEKLTVDRNEYLHTGSTMLNLALTNKYDCGFLSSHYFHILGSSSSGKTFLSMTCFAESNLSTKYKDYKLIYDASEDGCLMDVSSFFGERTSQRIEAPAYGSDGMPRFSTTIESFYYHLADAMNGDVPCIYVLDSIDALTSDADQEKFTENKDAFEQGKQSKGSYAMSRAKKNSENLRKVMADLTRTGSILIILSQTRQNIGGHGTVCAGGASLRFYATAAIESKSAKKITRTIDGNEIVIGKNIELAIRKNRITGYEHTVKTAIYPGYGIADLPSVIDYLLEVKHWRKEGRSVVADEFDFKGLPDTLITKLEEEGKEDELRQLAEKVWNNFLDKSTPKWKKRYE